jgi:hypothetical protein
MPYVSNQGVRIYYEVEGTGPPLFSLMESVPLWKIGGK